MFKCCRSDALRDDVVLTSSHGGQTYACPVSDGDLSEQQLTSRLSGP